MLIAIVIGTFLLSFYNWRCSACDKYIGRSLFPNFCQKCGAKFVEE